MQNGETTGSESVSEREKAPGFYRDDREVTLIDRGGFD
jgi:hypothetical protein